MRQTPNPWGDEGDDGVPLLGAVRDVRGEACGRARGEDQRLIVDASGGGDPGFGRGVGERDVVPPDLAALRRLPPRVVGVLESLEPVVAALAGIVILSEYLSATQWFAASCITGASIGAVVSRRGRRDTR